MAVPAPATCQIRECLFADYKRVTAYYYTTISNLLDSMSLDKVAEQTATIYDAVVAARENLQEHEAEHGCR